MSGPSSIKSPALLAMVRTRVTNKEAGLRRPPSGWALFCQHVAKHGVSEAPGLRLSGKTGSCSAQGRKAKWILVFPPVLHSK